MYIYMSKLNVIVCREKRRGFTGRGEGESLGARWRVVEIDEGAERSRPASQLFEEGVSTSTEGLKVLDGGRQLPQRDELVPRESETTALTAASEPVEVVPGEGVGRQ